LRITIPPNTRATVHLPSANGAEVSEGGKSADEAESVELLRTDGEETVLSVRSGRYEFVGRVAEGS